MNATLANIRPAEILLVEDNDDEVELTRIAVGASALRVNLHRAKDGEVCLAFLRKQGGFAGAPTPDLILLDLNLPRMGGREVLEEISRDESLRHLPVVILTTSQDEREILNMYRLRCSSYIVKPLSFDRFQHAIQMLLDYWLTVVVLPSPSRITKENS